MTGLAVGDRVDVSTLRCGTGRPIGLGTVVEVVDERSSGQYITVLDDEAGKRISVWVSAKKPRARKVELPVQGDLFDEPAA